MSQQQKSGKKIDVHQLTVDTFRNGDVIPQAETDEAWINAGKNGKPAWCWATTNSSVPEKKVKLYNWYAINDIRGICPDGMRLLNEKELEFLMIPFQSSTSTVDPEYNLKLAGMRSHIDGKHYLSDTCGYYWSECEVLNDFAKTLTFMESDALISLMEKGNGCSVAIVEEGAKIEDPQKELKELQKKKALEKQRAERQKAMEERKIQEKNKIVGWILLVVFIIFLILIIS